MLSKWYAEAAKHTGFIVKLLSDMHYACNYVLSEIGISIDANFDDSEEKSLDKSSDVLSNESCQENKSSISEAVTKMFNAVSEIFEEEIEDIQEIAIPLVTRERAVFVLPKSAAPTYLNIHFICEAASRLLFHSIHWAKELPVFSSLK